MRIKNLVLTSALTLSLIGPSLASATEVTTATTKAPLTSITQPAAKITPHKERHHHGYHYHDGVRLLTEAQRAELRTIRQNTFEQMKPLLKEKQALQLQLRGKIATPNMTWSDITTIVNKINDNNAKMTTLLAKTQFTTFQKLGIMFPRHHQSHTCHPHAHQGRYHR